jgi:hypothetical protein
MIEMAKGTYYIGDPGYVFDKSWTKVLDLTDDFEKNDGVFTIDGETGYAGSTAYGDGTYIDNHRRRYFVDSGLLSILPVSFLDIDEVFTRESVKKFRGAHLITFKEDFVCDIDDGVFTFGDIVIDTKGD